MFSKNRKNKPGRKNKQGFLMVDAAFSIFIVGTILITFMAVMASVYRTEFAKRDLIIATNLAQEGIEIVRNIRDYNWKKGNDAFFWENSAKCGGYDYRLLRDGGINLRVFYNSNYISPQGGANKLQIDADGFYRHSAGTVDTKFSREVDIVVVGDEQRNITSRVEWDGKVVTITDTLYAWGDAD